MTGVLEAESGFNDAPVVILVVAFSTAGPVEHWYVLVGEIALELAIGAAIGLAVGWLGAYGLRHVALPASGLYPIAVMAIAVSAYAAGALAHGSGFLAVYLASLVLGNARLPHWPATRGFAEGLGWLAQIGMFVLLGLLVTPHELGDDIWPAVDRRPGADRGGPARCRCWSACCPFRMPWREQALHVLGGAARRGAHRPGDHPHGGEVRGQPPDLQHRLRAGRRLHAGPGPDAALAGHGAAARATARRPPTWASSRRRWSGCAATCCPSRSPSGSRMHGVEVGELRLPPGAAVTLVVRDGKSFVPLPSTVLRRGDELLVVATDPVRDAAEERLRAVGRAASWRAGWAGGTSRGGAGKGREPRRCRWREVAVQPKVQAMPGKAVTAVVGT